VHERVVDGVADGGHRDEHSVPVPVSWNGDDLLRELAEHERVLVGQQDHGGAGLLDGQDLCGDRLELVVEGEDDDGVLGTHGGQCGGPVDVVTGDGDRWYANAGQLVGHYAADLSRGLPSRRSWAPPGRCPPSHNWQASTASGPCPPDLSRSHIEGLIDAGSSRTPLRLARRTHAIWQY
jgi:hypothetical protein